MAKKKEWYEVVNITGISNDIVYGDVLGRFESKEQAKEASAELNEKGWNTVAPNWAQSKERGPGEQFEMFGEQSEEIKRIAEEVQQQTNWDLSDRTSDLNWTVVQVEGTRNGMVYGEYVGNFDSRQEAKEAAEAKWNQVAVPWSYGENQIIGNEFECVLGRSTELDKIGKTVDRAKEVTEDLVVCRWDGRNGPPIIGQMAEFDSGRDWNANARERMAKPLGLTGESIDTEMYVMLRKGDGIERQGEIVQISDREETLNAWIEQCREAEEYLAEDGLENASFGIDREALAKLDEITEQREHQSEIEKALDD